MFRAQARTDEALARAELTVRSYERADEYRRQRLWLRHHRESLAIMSPLQHVFHSFRARLLYTFQLRSTARRHEATLLCRHALQAFRRWHRYVSWSCRPYLLSLRSMWIPWTIAKPSRALQVDLAPDTSRT